MIRSYLIAVAATVAVLPAAAVLSSCREEPTIVIKFEPTPVDAGKAPPAANAAATRPAAVGAPDASAPPSRANNMIIGECNGPGDCVVEPVDCCDCANGGKQHAMPKARVAASKAARERRCRGKMCTMMLSTDPTCGQRAGCTEHRCVMVDQKR